MATLTQLQTWLSEAETARHALMTGQRVVTLAHGTNRSVSFQQAEMQKLEAYIATLRAEIAALGGGDGAGRRGPLLVHF
jgi:cell division protein FtsB